MNTALSIVPIPAFKDNYIWLIVDQTHANAVCVDPGDATPVLAFLQQQSLNLCAIFITHHHYDHSGGIARLLEHSTVPVYGPSNDNVAGVTQALRQDDIVTVEALDLKFSVLDIPGHTRGHIAFYGHRTLFCGDTLFSAGCGRVFEGTFAMMYHSLQKLAQLPDDTLVYCAHEYTLSNLRFAQTVEPKNTAIQQRINEVHQMRNNGNPSLPSTIALEKQCNPFLRCSEPDIKQAVTTQGCENCESEIEVFTTLRTWKDNV